MKKEQFLEMVKNRHLYKVLKPLPGELSYAKVGDKYYSETLYDRSYNMLKLVEEGYLQVCDEPFEWQKDIVGKNCHSVFVKCSECGSWGVNEPLNIECGNCGYPKCITYYDAQTINDNLINNQPAT